MSEFMTVAVVKQHHDNKESTLTCSSGSDVSLAT